MLTIYHKNLASAIKLDNDQLNHIKARRVRCGEKIRVVNGQGYFQYGFLNNKEVILTDQAEFLAKSKPRALAMSWSKPAVMDLIVEKACEFSISDIYIFISDYVGNRPSNEQISSRYKRFEQLMVSALCQSEGLYLPNLHPVLTLHSILNINDFVWYTLDMTGLKPVETNASLGVILGPEGGFSPEEKVFLRQNSQGVWKLSDNILRVETAALASMAIMEIFCV